MTIIALDTETGGLIPGQHALLSVGLAELDSNFEPVRKMQVLMFPAFNCIESQINPEALKWNGYTREGWLAKGAVELREGMQQVADWLDECADGVRFPLCHGAPFDRPFIEAAERLSKIPLGLGHRWRCSHALAYGVQDALGLQFDSASLDCLGVMCGHWEPGQRAKAHDALEDALACAAVYRWLTHMMKQADDYPVCFYPPGHKDQHFQHAKQGWYHASWRGAHAGPFATEKEALAEYDVFKKKIGIRS